MADNVDQYIERLRNALERAQREQDSLPLSVPSPTRDMFYDFIVKKLMDEDLPHHAASCQGCQGFALSMSLSALGWEDPKAPRPATPKERMETLMEQMRIALAFLEKLHGQALHR